MMYLCIYRFKYLAILYLDALQHPECNWNMYIYIYTLCYHVRVPSLLIEMLSFYINCMFFLVVEYCTIAG